MRQHSTAHSPRALIAGAATAGGQQDDAAASACKSVLSNVYSLGAHAAARSLQCDCRHSSATFRTACRATGVLPCYSRWTSLVLGCMAELQLALRSLEELAGLTSCHDALTTGL